MREMGLSVMVVTVYLAGYRVEPSCFDVVRAGVLRYWHDVSSLISLFPAGSSFQKKKSSSLGLA